MNSISDFFDADKVIAELPPQSTYGTVRDYFIESQKEILDSPHIHVQQIGKSEGGRDITSYCVGSGPKKISLIAGCHADEPLGPTMLRSLVLHIRSWGLSEGLAKKFTFSIVPCVNPDGEQRNLSWINEPANMLLYSQKVLREGPGRDMEFGFPAMRQENRVLSSFMKKQGPFHLHMSFHGMFVSEGPMLLIERSWIDRTKNLREKFSEFAHAQGYRLHDHDREGQKGFDYIGPGFTTTPESKPMKKHFLDLNDKTMADMFHLSSMEYVNTLRKDTLSLVTEIPLFAIGLRYPNHDAKKNTTYMQWLNDYKSHGVPRSEAELAQWIKKYELKSVPIEMGLAFHCLALNLGLRTILDKTIEP